MSFYIRFCFLLLFILNSYYGNAQKINITSQPSTIYQCLNNKVIFQVSTDLSLGVNLQWYKNNTLLTGQNSTTLLLNNIVDSDTGIYVAKIWTLTDTIYSDTARLIINPQTIISLQPQLTNVCYKTASKIKVLASGGGILSYQWYKNGLKLTGQTKDSLCFDETNYSDTANYYVSIRGLCDSTISNIVKLNIFPNQQPNLPNISYLCNNSNTLEVGKFKDYLWSNGQITSRIYANVNGKYWIKATDTNNCISSDTTMVILNSLANIYAGKDTVMCNILELKLNANYINADSVIWQNNSFGSFNNKFSSNTIFTPNSLYAGNCELIILAKNKCGVISDTLKLTLTPVPDASFDLSDSVVCKDGTPIVLKPTDNSGIFFGKNVFDKLFTPRDSGFFTIQYQVTKNFCTSYTKKTIEVVAQPIADFYYKPTNPSIDKSVQFFSNSKFTNNYLWTFENTTFSNIQNPIYHFLDEGFYRIQLKAINRICSDTTSKLLYIKGSNNIFIPNAFTPNQNGLNEEFKVLYKNSKGAVLSIYNRWGQLIFTSNNVNKGWDGTFDGNPCQEDVYYYIVDYTNNDDIVKQLKGNITLIR